MSSELVSLVPAISGEISVLIVALGPSVGLALYPALLSWGSLTGWVAMVVVVLAVAGALWLWRDSVRRIRRAHARLKEFRTRLHGAQDHVKVLQRELDQTARLSAIGQLAAEIAHQIRNPLSSIRLDLEMLEEELSNLPSENADEARSLLHSIQSEVRALVSLTDNYLRFARTPDVKVEKLDLGGLCREIVELMAPEVRERNIQAHLHCEHAGLVNGDRLQLRVVMANLVRNAIDAMPNGGRLTISAEPAGERVRVSVSDTGCGIPPEELEEIFRPFFSTKSGGTGLGLAIAKPIVEAHGSSLVCHSLVGVGTTFSFDLPSARKGESSYDRHSEANGPRRG